MKLWAWLGRIVYWAVWPGSWLYLKGSRRARLLLVCGDEILVVNNWLGTGKWSLPGGGLHKNEDAAQGLVREVREETGISLAASDAMLLAEEPFQRHGFSYRCVFFMAIVPKKPPAKPRRPEITAARWAARHEITPKNYAPDVIRTLTLLDSHDSRLLQ